MSNIEAFVKELSELTKKYGLVIGGCGCCGSPYIRQTHSNTSLYENLQYNEKTEIYTYYEG